MVAAAIPFQSPVTDRFLGLSFGEHNTFETQFFPAMISVCGVLEIAAIFLIAITDSFALNHRFDGHAAGFRPHGH